MDCWFLIAPCSGTFPAMSGDEMQTKGQPSSPVRKMKLRYAGSCSACGAAQSAGAPALYNRLLKSVMCLGCADGAPAAPPSPVPAPLPTTVPAPAAAPTPAPTPVALPAVDTIPAVLLVPATGTAGASAVREFERRKQKRETRICTEHPRLGKLILAFSDEPTSTRVWQTGAVGEQRLGRALDVLTGAGVLVLHDRRIPGSRANIDHMAVGPSGVFVVDAKRYRDKRPERRVEGGLLRPRVEKLFVGGRDRTSLVDGIAKQVDLVVAALKTDGATDVVVRGMLCFVDADWPLIGGSFKVCGFEVLSPRLMQKSIGSAGQLDSARVAELHRLLAAGFPPA